MRKLYPTNRACDSMSFAWNDILVPRVLSSQPISGSDRHRTRVSKDLLGDLIGTRFQQFPPTITTDQDVLCVEQRVRNRLREQSASVITSVLGSISPFFLSTLEKESTMMDHPIRLTRRYAFLPSPSWKVATIVEIGRLSLRGWSRLK